MIDTIYSDPNFLEHHGVKGMHWGVRKDEDNKNRAIRVAKGSPVRNRHHYGDYTTYKTKTQGNVVINRKTGDVVYQSPDAKNKLQNNIKSKTSSKSSTKLSWKQQKVSDDARKDATEFARAKMFYGKGAGTRRKLIKATVEEKKKKDPFYASEFEKHLANQDMEKHAKAAKSERKSKDAQEKVSKTVRGVTHLAAGDGAAVSQGSRVAFEILKRYGGIR